MLNELFQTGWAAAFLRSDLMLAALIAVVLLIAALVQFHYEVFYSREADHKAKRHMDEHPLNTKYGFKKRRDLDVRKINLYVLFAHLTAILTGFIVMLVWNVIAGFIVYAVLAVGGELLTVRMIGEHPEWVSYRQNRTKQTAPASKKNGKRN